MAAQNSTPLSFKIYLESSALAFLKRYLKYDLRMDIDFESGIEGVIDYSQILIKAVYSVFFFSFMGRIF